MRRWGDGVGVSGGFDDMGVAACWLFSASETGWIIGYLHFDDVISFKKKRMALSRQGVKQYGNPSVSFSSALAMSVIYTWWKAGFFQFYDVICTERNFIIFGVVIDILDWHPRHHLARDHRNQKALFFFFFTDVSHSTP